MIAFVGSQSMATRARAMGIEITHHVLPDEMLLQAYVLNVLKRAVKTLDRNPEWQRVGGFDQHLDGEYHRAPPRTSRRTVCPP
jgi:hypothetical protein